jgi:hypothetical protein
MRLGRSFLATRHFPRLLREIAMPRTKQPVVNRVLRLWVCFVLGTCAVMQLSGEEKAVTQTAGVDNTRMGAYRALAQLSFQAFQKGDNATAAELACILERTWDQGQWKNSSPNSFCQTNRAVCQPIDRTLDLFIGPIMNWPQKAPDHASVEAAYNVFLDRLKQGDR